MKSVKVLVPMAMRASGELDHLFHHFASAIQS
jgi:hypothetical protein